MRTQKFLPDVKRNRLVTNWVQMREQSSSHQVGIEGRKRELKRRATLFSLCLLLAIILTIVTFQKPTRPSSALSIATEQNLEPASTAKVKTEKQEAPEACDIRDAISLTGIDSESTRAAPLVEGFETMTSHLLGGVLVAEYRCVALRTDALFRVRWELANTRWQVKEISRPPLRQPGNF